MLVKGLILTNPYENSLVPAILNNHEYMVDFGWSINITPQFSYSGWSVFAQKKIGGDVLEEIHYNHHDLITALSEIIKQIHNKITSPDVQKRENLK